MTTNNLLAPMAPASVSFLQPLTAAMDEHHPCQDYPYKDKSSLLNENVLITYVQIPV